MRESVSRTLSVHTEHELLLALEKAGIAKVAQRIIESEDNALAIGIVSYATGIINRANDQKEAPKSHGQNFTERVRNILALAREEAAKMNHEYVGTEHLLLAIITEGEGVAMLVLYNLKVNTEEIQRKIQETRKAHKPQGPSLSAQDLPFTSRSKKVIELAMREARDLNRDFVGSEHLLLGLLAEEKGVSAQMLTEANLTLERLREEVKRVTEY